MPSLSTRQVTRAHERAAEQMKYLKTKEWATAHGVSVVESIPPADATEYEVHRSASDIAKRSIVLHAVAAVGYGVRPEPIIDWLKTEKIWNVASKDEERILTSDGLSYDTASEARWRQEAEWALLWMINKVASLGLPTSTCDTAKLVDEIMPSLGEPIATFVSSATLRSHGALLAEDDRVYSLHSYARAANRDGSTPDDLIYDVLYQRHYAFEWLNGDDWDDIRVDT